jgi:hypothetical protein
LKVYSTVAGGAAGEGVEYDLEAITWDGRSLAFTQHLDLTTSRTFQGAVSGRQISGTYSPGAGIFSGTRAEVLTYGLAPKTAAAQNVWSARTRRQLEHLMMQGNPQPLSRNVTVLNANVAPTLSTTLPPNRDDDPATWPQHYTMVELQFDYTLPNPYGGAAMARSSHAYLATPTTPPPAGGKYPALLAVNGHGGSAWKMMNPDDGYFWYGDSFARRGFVVLAVDISHRPLADRANLYGDTVNGDDSAHGNGSHPAIKAEGFDSDWEENGERSWDVMRALDYLRALPNVDANRVVISGISLGGEVTAITGGLEPRFAMSIPAGYSPDEGVLLYHGHPCWRWRHADVREYANISDFFALTAPRPLLIETGKVDFIFSDRHPPFSADKQVVRRTLAAYDADAAQVNLYLHYDQHHYHVGDINPTSPTEQGVQVPDQLAPTLSSDLTWQTDASTHELVPTLFDAIALSPSLSPDFSLAASPSSMAITAGQSASWILAMTPSGGFSNSLSISCANLPPLSTCNLSPATLQADGAHTATSQISISTTARSLASFDLNGPRTGRFRLLPGSERLLPPLWASLLLVSFLGLGLGRRRRGRAWLTLSVVLLSGVLWASCGGSGGGVSKPSTPAGTYQINIVAASGTLQHNTSVTLVVN